MLERNEEISKVDWGYYSKSISIIQSSGMGKSRLAAELGLIVFSITFTFRNDRDGGYPPGDYEVLQFLQPPGRRAVDIKDRVDIHSRVASVLAYSLCYGKKFRFGFGCVLNNAYCFPVNEWLDSVNYLHGVAPGDLARLWHEQQNQTNGTTPGGRSEAKKKFCTHVLENAAVFRQQFNKDAEWTSFICSDEQVSLISVRYPFTVH